MEKKFDLEKRTAELGKNVIIFCRTLRITIINESLIKQIIRSATSVGANYMEANGGNSKRDFKNKISLCKKESKETEHWLKMLAVTNEDKKVKLRELWHETHELTLIFSKILASLSNV